MWQDVGVLTLNVPGQWFFSDVIEQDFSLIQLHHGLDFGSVEQFKPGAFIALFYENQTQIYSPKTFVYRDIAEIINFTNLDIEQRPKIGIKRLDDLNIIWRLELKVMPSFNKVTSERKSLKAITNVYSVDVSTYVKIAETNEKRYGLTIYNDSDYQVIVGTGNDSDETPGRIDAILETINPNSMYELPVSGSGSIYTGKIYAVGTSEPSSINVTEFVPHDS